MPALTRKKARAAIDKHERRYGAPAIEINTNEEGGREFANPFRDEDRDDWQALVFEAFGTCSVSVVQTFLNQLSGYCTKEWGEGERGWRPNAAQLTAAINIIASMKPENEAQACMAAQMVALHYSAMKLTNPDERTAATLVRMTRGFGEAALTLSQLQGKVQRKQVNQTIQVIYADNRSVNLNGGEPEIGGQAHGTTRGETVQRPALPSPSEADWEAVPVASREGQASMPDSWWGSRLWRSIRGS